jgi:hypothetical protein
MTTINLNGKTYFKLTDLETVILNGETYVRPVFPGAEDEDPPVTKIIDDDGDTGVPTGDNDGYWTLRDHANKEPRNREYIERVYGIRREVRE